MKTSVCHCKALPGLSEEDRARYVYVGRPSRFGNPFSHKENTIAEFKVESIDQALSSFEHFVQSTPGMVEQIKTELTGKILGCWCKTRIGFKGQYKCHAQYLAALCEGCKPEEID